MELSVILWVALAVILVIIEGVTTMLVSIWTALGAVAAAIAAACGASAAWQCTAFLAVSLVLLLATRPLARKLLKKDWQPTNSDRLIGQTAVVTEEIIPMENRGRVRINGKSWAARSADGERIAEGAFVKVEKIEGVKLIVIQ